MSVTLIQSKEGSDYSHVTVNLMVIGPKVSVQCASMKMAVHLSRFALMANLQRRSGSLKMTLHSPEIIIQQAGEEGRESREKQLIGGLLQTLSLMVSLV